MDKSVILLLVTALEVKLTHNLMIFYQIMRDFFGDVKSLQSVFIVILGDSNAPSKSWWSDDSITTKGTKLDFLAAIHQLISEPTQAMLNSLPCIDIIFTDQPSLVVDSGVHTTLLENIHHQIKYCKLSIQY